MDDILKLITTLQGAFSEASKSGQAISLLGIAVVFSKYWLDVYRSVLVQKFVPEKYQWANLTDSGKRVLSLAQSGLLAALVAIGAGTPWYWALLAGVLGGAATTGLHDTGALPGKKPAPVPYQPSPSRPSSLTPPLNPNAS